MLSHRNSNFSIYLPSLTLPSLFQYRKNPYSSTLKRASRSKSFSFVSFSFSNQRSKTQPVVNSGGTGMIQSNSYFLVIIADCVTLAQPLPFPFPLPLLFPLPLTLPFPLPCTCDIYLSQIKICPPSLALFHSLSRSLSLFFYSPLNFRTYYILALSIAAPNGLCVCVYIQSHLQQITWSVFRLIELGPAALAALLPQLPSGRFPFI